ncbi:MAG TPA: 4Fe-4S binding protein, partial [Ktedonobacteraceae bacterium]|nr:4Fe-4S binding protein [Ktedonobacteraceae bacterium]
THECIMCGSCVPVCPVDNHRDLLMLSLKERLGVSWNSKPDMRCVADSLPAGWTIAMLISCLREQPILRAPQQVPDTYLLHIIAASKMRILVPGETAMREGEYGRDLYLILEGFVKVARRTTAGTGQHESGERIIAYRQGGDYFAGGLDLLGDGQAVTVATINPCRVAEVPRQALLALFQKYPEVNHRFSLRLREYLEAAASTQGYALSTGELHHFAPTASPADLKVQAGLHSLVSDGVVEGTEVLVIDLDKCIHCNECEEACARRHGHSRMNRKGMVVGNISIATACRQCQNPVCMLCSRAGIARHPNGEVYITESCIGCGICAERCPYGAISIVQIEDESAAQSSWQRFSEFFTKGTGKERARRTLPVVSVEAAGGNYAAPGPLDTFQARSGYDELRKKVAIKCDLCAGYSDQACVQACPTGAAIRIQPTQFFGSTEEILQRHAQ